MEIVTNIPELRECSITLFEARMKEAKKTTREVEILLSQNKLLFDTGVYNYSQARSRLPFFFPIPNKEDLLIDNQIFPITLEKGIIININNTSYLVTDINKTDFQFKCQLLQKEQTQSEVELLQLLKNRLITLDNKEQINLFYNKIETNLKDYIWNKDDFNTL